jgi:hypothetical protein
MIFLVGLAQMCLAYYTWQAISDLAREGTRWAIVRGATCETSAGTTCTASESDIEQYVRSITFPNVAGGTFQPTASWPGGGPSGCAVGLPQIGCPVQVTVTYTFPWRIPFATPGALSLSSTSVMYIVQ